MTASADLLALPNVEAAIDANFAVVAPETPLNTVIALLSHTRQQNCTLQTSAPRPEQHAGFTDLPRVSSCVLIMAAGSLLGIFTERDIVKLSLRELDWQTTTIATVMAHPVVTLNIALFKDIFAVLFLFRRYHIRHLPIVQTDGTVLGIVSPESIRDALQPANLLKFRRVSDVMSKTVHHLPPTATVRSAAQMMADQRVSCVVVVQVDEDERLHPLGIVTERDIVQFQFLELNLEHTCVEAVMSTPLFILEPQDSLWRAHQEMQRRHVRRLVVAWNWGRNLGIVTQTSILRVFDPVEMYSIIQTLQTPTASSTLNVDDDTDAIASTECLPAESLGFEPLMLMLQSLLDDPHLTRMEQEQRLRTALQYTQHLQDYCQEMFDPQLPDELPTDTSLHWPDESEITNTP